MPRLPPLPSLPPDSIAASAAAAAAAVASSTVETAAAEIPAVAITAATAKMQAAAGRGGVDSGRAVPGACCQEREGRESRLGHFQLWREDRGCSRVRKLGWQRWPCPSHFQMGCRNNNVPGCPFPSETLRAACSHH